MNLCMEISQICLSHSKDYVIVQLFLLFSVPILEAFEFHN